MSFAKKPTPPLGNTAEAIWHRALLVWLQGLVCHGIKGGKMILHAEGGYTLEVIPGKGGATPDQTCRVKSRNADYLICRTFDGTTEGTEDVNVAVQFDARSLAGETLDGTAYTYTYSGAATLLNRQRTQSSTGEIQQVTPLWKVDGLIKVTAINYTGVTVDGADLKLIEDSSRCWARVG